MQKVGIIGGGASGLMAAVVLKSNAPQMKVTVFERLERVGKKIALTGNGRCNISNKNINITNYHGNNPQFAEFALTNFDNKKTEDFFASLGVIFKEENGGKLYPYSLQASSVTDALRFAAAKLDVKIITDECIEKIKKSGSSYTLFGKEEYPCDAVILACGGVAGGKIGTDLGYKLAESLKHERTKLYPAIVQIKTDNQFNRSLKGVKVVANVAVVNKNGKTHNDFGEVLFCDYGLSGPPIMQLSRYMQEGTIINLDIMPDIPKNKLIALLKNRSNKFDTCGEYFCGLLQTRIGQTVLKMCGFSINDKPTFSDSDIKKIASIIKCMQFKFIDRMGFSAAQVTSGGLKTDEFYNDTLMSKRLKGLFACGELLDIDGDCGGYNLQWAWSSGYTAALGCKAYLEGR